MLLTDVFIRRGKSTIMIEHVLENLMCVRFLESSISGIVGLECSVTRPNADVTDALLPQALYFDACMKVAQFLELEVMDDREKLEQEITMSLRDVEIMRIFPLYYKEKDAWGADGHIVLSQDDVRPFSLPVPDKNSWQTVISSILVSPVMKMTLGPFTSYEDFVEYYHTQDATFNINNAREPLSEKTLSSFEKRAEAFADLLRKAKEWRPN